MARYVDGLKLQIRDKIGVTVLRNMSEAKNMALRAKLMMNERNTRFDGGSKRYGVEHVRNSRVVAKKNTGVVERLSGSGEKKDERTLGKRTIESRVT